ncbi:MAG: hypothetical protein PHP95_06105 [Desulfuromonadaceae bacterium]|nr:hypothetical protein [Desulfuromonadaceae bacterium]MDD2848012.1 hypothetical protein [Desulfuromonadaceae bacterium]MDD4131246.1 hypothetical protein [Desulfuromonadaceae bacterium]
MTRPVYRHFDAVSSVVVVKGMAASVRPAARNHLSGFLSEECFGAVHVIEL